MISLWTYILTLIVLIQADLALTQNIDQEMICNMTDNSIKVQLQQCRGKGDIFLHKYTNFRNGKRGETQMCECYLEYRSCLQPLLENCTNIREIFAREWGAIDTLMNCACVNKSTACQKDLKCMRQQLKDPLVLRCDIMYKFQRKQRVYDDCRLYREAMLCQGQLLRTSCGDAIGKAGFQLATLSAVHAPSKPQCPVSLKDRYDGFTYSSNCSANFTLLMDKCYFDHIHDKMILFKEENDLIAEGSHSDVKRACRNYRRYTECIKSITGKCERGIKLLYGMDGKLRTYLFKLDYICKKQHRGYHKKIKCIQGTIANATLQVCNPLWYSIQPYLDGITAYQFYCGQQINGTVTQRLHTGLENLRRCYRSAFSTYCGEHVGSIMNGLMEEVFHDPYYLRFKYRPRCEENLRSTTTESPTTTQPVTKEYSTRETTSRELIYAYKATSDEQKVTASVPFMITLCILTVSLKMTWR